jgi:hypothetical protein
MRHINVFELDLTGLLACGVHASQAAHKAERGEVPMEDWSQIMWLQLFVLFSERGGSAGGLSFELLRDFRRSLLLPYCLMCFVNTLENPIESRGCRQNCILRS